MSWKTIDNKLVQSFEFKNFIYAFAFLAKVAIISEKQNHHPEIYNVYNKVTLKLCTHDDGNKVTSKDEVLAELIDGLV